MKDIQIKIGEQLQEIVDKGWFIESIFQYANSGMVKVIMLKPLTEFEK